MILEKEITGWTTIIIEKRLREKLKKLKLTKRESYNEIIWRLIK